MAKPKQNIVRDQNGKFLPGTVANPNGRPRADKEFESLCQAISISSLNRVKAIIEKADDSNPNLMRAIQFAADRGWGKPKQKIEHSGPVDIANAHLAVDTDETAEIEDGDEA